jgi:hypothetical protein
MTLIYIVGAFLAGIFFHKVYSALAIIFGLKSQLLHVVENEILTFTVEMYTRLIMNLEAGYLAMKTAGRTEQQIKLLRNEDEHGLQEWRKEIIQTFIESYPEVYKPYLNIETWDDAMAQLAASTESPPEELHDEDHY